MARMINKNPTTPATAAATTATRPVRRSPRALKTLDLAFSSSVLAKRLTFVDLALLDPIGMHLVDQRLDRGSQPIPGGAQIGLDLGLAYGWAEKRL